MFSNEGFVNEQEPVHFSVRMKRWTVYQGVQITVVWIKRSSSCKPDNSVMDNVQFVKEVLRQTYIPHHHHPGLEALFGRVCEGRFIALKQAKAGFNL